MNTTLLCGLLLLGAIGGVASAQAPTTLNLYSEGDVNVKDLWEKNLIPLFQKANPTIKVNLVFSAHGANSQSTLDRMAAAKQAGKVSGVDILEGPVEDAASKGLLDKLSVQKVPLLARVSPNVLARAGSFGVPYRASSVVLAYDSSKVKTPPRTLSALIDWIGKNPGQFTYNAPDTGGSGNALVTRIMKLGIPASASTTFETDYDAGMEKYWEQGFTTLKKLAPNLYQNGQYSQNNVGTLQLLGKGAITMGPVWSDMGLSYLAQGLLPANIKLTQIDPPLSGGAAYIGVAADSANKAAAYTFLNWLLTPDVQAIVADKMNGYPGVQLKYMPAAVQQKFGDMAGDYSFGFSSKFNADMTRMWYERVAGTPQPQK
ncbi:extracellular solute-binding protein [Deinococcus sp. KSM4-11]|uniref:extracellular solute-binding protein n=1 Tax=Deinococcus sp. KSM4-11 TaxID=2568654 RepID=UPI0010A39249|nr:extracellular solute-binding protein [Deinococcus sp. KSM4-11]THF86758.1 extracellular solute-binding protein [Deinococcus sp. KSM4-11]